MVIRYIKAKLQKRALQKKEETPADKAARRTATATVWMALFTFVLAVATIRTLIEIHEGGIDTHNLAAAAQAQAEQMRTATSQTADLIQVPIPRV